jgi:ADP-heptose:LPS heptosyltransferase
MNFPGLELAAGVIRPWDMETCRKALEKEAKVLVCSTTALGDSILCTPLLKTLSDQLGRDRVGFVVKEGFADLYEGSSFVGHLFTIRGKFRGHRPLKAALRKKNFQVAMIANCTEPDFVPLLWWSGVRGFLRYRTRWSRWHKWFANPGMMRRPESPEYATGHAIENNLAMAEAVGIEATTRHLHLELGEAGIRENPPLVMIHPGASRREKCWPLERWGAVAKELSKRFGCRFMVTGGRGEWDLAEELTRQLPEGTSNLAGKLSLRALGEQQGRADLFLSGDTGPYHLAVAVGCPTVTLFAPRDRGSSVEACGPHLAPGHKHVAIQTEGFNQPIENIPLEPVMQAAIEVMAQGRTS